MTLSPGYNQSWWEVDTLFQGGIDGQKELILNAWLFTLFIQQVFIEPYYVPNGLPQWWWLGGKESACNAEDTGDAGSIPGWGRSPGGGHGYPLQYSCLEKPTDRGTWQASVHKVTKSQT